MTAVVADTDVVSFLFKNHPIGQRYDPELEDRMTPVFSIKFKPPRFYGRFRRTLQAKRTRLYSLEALRERGVQLPQGDNPFARLRPLGVEIP